MVPTDAAVEKVSIARRAVHAWRRVRLARLGDAPSWRGVGDGLEMLIDPSDWTDRAFYLNTFDPWLVHVMHRVVRPGETCLDIGAHKGYVAMRLARLVGPGGRVYAFEPDPRAREFLERHRDRNRLDRLTVFPYALGRDAGELSLSLSSNLGWSSLFPNVETRSTMTETLSVPVRSLDHLRRDEPLDLDPARLSFVKIDTEGAEPMVLDGMRELLASSRPTLWVEVNRDSLEAAGTSAGAIESRLRELGFTLFVPHRFRRFGVPQVVLQPWRDVALPDLRVFDVVACKGEPRGLPRA